MRFCGDVVATGVIEVLDSDRRQDIAPPSPKAALCQNLGSGSTLAPRQLSLIAFHHDLLNFPYHGHFNFNIIHASKHTQR